MKKTLTPITPWLILGAALAGCGDEGILLAEVIASSQPGTRPGDPPAPQSTDDAPVPALLPDDVPIPAPPTALDVLSANCGMCHRADLPPLGLISDITDIDALIDTGMIVPGNLEDSTLLARIRAGSMPPSYSGLPRVSDRDTQIVSDFILSLAPESGPIEAALEEILTSYCSDCHTGSPISASAGLEVIDDVDALIERGFIIPGSRWDSPVYARIAQGSMPPAYYQRPVSDADLERIGDFIDALYYY